jgi:hypothetical protein
MLAFVLLACSRPPVHDWLPPEAPTHRVTIDPKLSGNANAPDVFLYADVEGDPAADVCLRVWGDGRWTIAEDERAGLYDRETASGRVDADGRLEGSLDSFFRGARAIWRTETEVWIDGILVPDPPTETRWVRAKKRAVPYVPHIQTAK